MKKPLKSIYNSARKGIGQPIWVGLSYVAGVRGLVAALSLFTVALISANLVELGQQEKKKPEQR